MIDPVVFPLIGKKLSGATMFSTSIQRGLNGFEVRNANWQDAMRRFDVTPGIKSLADQETLESFFIACHGPVIGFLMRDWKDYKVASFGRGVAASVGGSDTVFQMEKTYTNGYRTTRRIITRPQAGTIILFDPDEFTISNGYTIDHDTGIITFDNPQSAPPMWTGQFYCPARFEADEIPWDIIRQKLADNTGHGEMPEVIIVETREDED